MMQERQEFSIVFFCSACKMKQEDGFVTYDLVNGIKKCTMCNKRGCEVRWYVSK